MGDAPAENMITSAVSTARPAATTPHPGTLQTNQASTGAQPILAGPDDLFELIVRPLVKQSVRQRDRSGEVYRHDVFTGNFFNSIMEAIWEKYPPIVKHRAVKMNGVWSVETPDIAAWSTVMQFKVEKRLVSPNKNDDGWNEWLEKNTGATVTLMIYDYGMEVVTAKDRVAFLKACILPRETDRAGATAESSLREVVEALQQKWGGTFQASATVWRMWANRITRNLDRSTWAAEIANLPPSNIVHLLDPAESRLEAHLTDVAQSSNVALDCMLLDVFLDDQEQRLVARESIIEGIIRDLAPPSASEVVDPLPLIENIEDTEHAA
ncbi:hypothetical protein F442_04186 [Phytophthora nicotianae P10297]|uniref:Uncharacterized protein n=1 Tax=Phytophthora nicotianae P10297 TaxID=1317064 RepID=W2ZTC5_PHYNI|nr:hypothetical protein F442_04186 [Phytophthora nicotianae P10297]